jgi:hypothetical protein
MCLRDAQPLAWDVRDWQYITFFVALFRLAAEVPGTEAAKLGTASLRLMTVLDTSSGCRCWFCQKPGQQIYGVCKDGTPIYNARSRKYLRAAPPAELAFVF